MTPDDLTDDERVLLDRLQELDDGADLWDRLAKRRGAKLTPHLLRQRMAVLAMHYGDAKAAALATHARLLMPERIEMLTRKGMWDGWPMCHVRGHFVHLCKATDRQYTDTSDFIQWLSFDLPGFVPNGAKTKWVRGPNQAETGPVARWTVDVLLSDPVEVA